MRIRVLVQTNHFFGNTNTQKTVAKEKTFAQKKNRLLCICVLVYRGKEITALVRRERYNLEIFQGQDYDSLDIVIRLIKT